MARLEKTRINQGGRLLAICAGAAAIACLLAVVGCKPRKFAFREVTSVQTLDSIDQQPSAGAYRQRFVEIEPEAFEALAGPNPLEESIHLNLFPDTVATVFFDRFEDFSATEIHRVLYGKVAASPESRVVVALRGEVMAAGVTFADGERYSISHAGSGVHRIREIDPAAFDCGVDESELVEMPPAEPIDIGFPPDGGLIGVPNQSLEEPTGTDTGFVIDVMVVYSKAALDRFADSKGIETQIELAVAETNQAYEDSGVIQRLRLVHTEEVAYEEHSGDVEVQKSDGTTEIQQWSEMMMALYDVTEGTVDDVHELRNTHGADQVSFWIDAPPEPNANIYVGGIAWSPDTDERLQTMASGAFSVVNAYGDPERPFAHELAHNQGAHHDPGTLQEDKGLTRAQFEAYANAAPEWLSFGYCDPQGDFATIMAYGHLCVPRADNIMRFSNPQRSYRPVGSDEEKPTGDSWSDVRSTLNTNYPIAVNWRDATDLRPAPVPLRPNDVVTTRQPEFVWEEAPGAPAYRVRITDEYGSSWATPDLLPSYQFCDSGVCSYQYRGPELPNATHSWTVGVVSFMGGPSYARSEWLTFEVAAPPEAPTPIAPAGTTNQASPTFYWTRVPGASKYSVSFTTGEFAASVSAMDAGCASGESTCSFRPGWTIAAGRSYRWMVAGANGYAQGPWSAPLLFQADDVLIGGQEPIGPQPIPSTDDSLPQTEVSPIYQRLR